MIENVVEVARNAGRLILEIYRSDDFEVEFKQKDQSPLTKADLAANTAIIEGLKKISEYPIVTEESYVDYEQRKHWDKFWLVDPLDGTKNFIAKDGQFTVNIALIAGYEPVLGVVHVPAFGIMYWAVKGKGAYKNGKRIINESRRVDLIGADSTFHSTAATQAFFERHGIRHVKGFGSAIKICKLAEGEIDVYPRLNGTKEWDTAAAHIIANEANCKVVDIETGDELIYNKEDIRNNFFIASRNDLDFVNEAGSVM